MLSLMVSFLWCLVLENNRKQVWISVRNYGRLVSLQRDFRECGWKNCSVDDVLGVLLLFGGE